MYCLFESDYHDDDDDDDDGNDDSYGEYDNSDIDMVGSGHDSLFTVENHRQRVKIR